MRQIQSNAHDVRVTVIILESKGYGVNKSRI
jgi:hypothetical protein